MLYDDPPLPISISISYLATEYFTYVQYLSFNTILPHFPKYLLNLPFREIRIISFYYFLVVLVETISLGTVVVDLVRHSTLSSFGMRAFSGRWSHFLSWWWFSPTCSRRSHLRSSKRVEKAPYGGQKRRCKLIFLSLNLVRVKYSKSYEQEGISAWKFCKVAKYKQKYFVESSS